MASAQVALATITLGSAQSTVTFSSIPATYRDLRLVVQGIFNQTGQTIAVRLNGDTGTNYSYVAMTSGNSGGTTPVSTSGSTTSLNLGFYNVGTVLTEPTNFLADFLDYAATDKHKSVLARTGHSSEVTSSTGRWANTAAVTTLAVSANWSGAYFAAGSTFALYGVVA